MDYYIVVNGQKQGPFDLLGFIKKVKNGQVTAETPVSTNPDGPYVPAAELPEVKDLLANDSVSQQAHAFEGGLNVNRVVADAIELWTRKVIEYTMMVAIIMVFGMLLSMVLKKIQFVADYSYIADYFASTLITTLLGVFIYYVLVTKRNQEIDKKDLGAITKEVLPSLLAYSALLSLLVIAFGMHSFIGLLICLAAIVLLSITAFVPFLVTDHKIKLSRAVTLSIGGFKSLGGQGMLLVFGLFTANIFAAALPAIVHNDAAFIIFVIVLPITTSILSYIYDQVLA